MWKVKVTNMSETVIRTEKLCCQSGKHYLLKDISWEVKQGEHWIVFGLNGSGKTTLLSTVAGYKSYSGNRFFSSSFGFS